MNDIPGRGESVSKGVEESTMWCVENYGGQMLLEHKM